MKISGVSEKYDLSTDTLRYYERIGLIPAVKRDSNGVREYDEMDCRWIEFIKCMRNAGLSVESLIEYVKLFQLGESTHEARKTILVEQRDQLIERITQMQETLTKLDFKINNYDSKMVKVDTKLTRQEL